MKKILAFILIISCIFALASCNLINPPKTDDIDNEGNKQTVAAIQDAIDNSAPKSADITVKFTSEIGDLNGSYDVTYNTDGSATVAYKYELFNKFDANAERKEYKSEYKGEVTVLSNGDIDGELGGVASVEAVSFDIELNEKLLKSAKVSASVLTAVIEAENTYDILGVEIPYDVNMTISTGSGKVTSIVLSYETESGPVEITAVYHY